MIIALVGYARSGKNFLASMYPNYICVAFADMLKKEANDIVRKYTGSELNFFNEETKVKFRSFLVGWGEIRRHFNPDFWIERVIEKMNENPYADYIITDCRYKNEAIKIKESGGIIVYISRNGADAANETERKSIREIVNENLVDFWIENNGTAEELLLRTQPIFTRKKLI